MSDKDNELKSVNHEEALALAHLNKEKSNLARCYIDREKALKDKVVMDAEEFGYVLGTLETYRELTGVKEKSYAEIVMGKYLK